MGGIVEHPDWPRCRPWIIAALNESDGFETIEDVEQQIDEGYYQFWPGFKSAAITEIAQFKRRKTLTVVHGGGDLRELLDVIEPILCAHAKKSGCDAIMGNGRLGWDRVCKKRGYRLAWIVMKKDLP